ncbi:lipopolysaccharide transport periplasmic protein LptA [Cognatilysobacter bugurensis]|uniref:Lipopolysaccharide export system protein LptA n=1 Tax=Cognatilysobacter bugurensis TaxID=543356 RepID=A0A918T0S7_9GAMM|nr:lipopolysaccharide transport periplasmic protein LptA [Lysobacter bugurensis]GHA77412.1 lipopolysaccharide export system protein LptA [Lysobacter bugurensis]
MNALRASSLALLLTLSTCPVVADARSSDRNQPMDIDAGATDYSLDDRRPTVLSGNVEITQGTLDIRSDRAEITQKGGEPVRVVLSGGPVKLNQQLDDGSPMSATASKVDYDLTTEIVIFIGNVAIKQPRGSLTGERVVYNMRTGQVQSGGKDSGRVKMRILPRNAQGGG